MSYSKEQVFEASLKYFGGSEMAAKVFTDKYALENDKGTYDELTPDDMHKRMAKEFARIEAKYPNPLSEEEIYNYFKNFEYIIPGGSPMEGIGNNYRIQSLSNCFVIDGAADSYGGIMKTDQEQAQLMKRRGGVGHDLGKIRPKGLKTSNAAKTTDGLGIFMERFSNTTREVAQNGRRGALMLSLPISYPESETFITIKNDRSKVTGANISIRFDNEFMHAVKEDKKYLLMWPEKNPSIIKEINARKLWNLFISNTWEHAEPGALFWDTIKKYTPSDIYEKYGFGTVSTNPCIVGDTLVVVADGRGEVTIKQLAEENKDVPVYCINKEGEKCIRIMRNPRITGYNKDIYKVTFHDNSFIKVTGNHKLLTINGEYKEVIELVSGDEIYSTTIKNDIVINNEFGYNTKEVNGKTLYEKKCEICGESFWVEYNEREQSYCNHKCVIEYLKKNDNVIFNKFKDNDDSKIIINIELIGKENVYNGTVDEYHNFYIKPFNQVNESNLLINNKNCGEIPLCPYDSCRLMALNLISYVVNPFTKDAYFDFEKFKTHVRDAQRLMDDLVDLEIEKIDAIIAKIMNDPEDEEVKRVEIKLWEKVRETGLKGRRTGLGITALGDAIAYLNLKFGSDESIAITEEIIKALATSSYRSSIYLAKERGAFEIYNFEMEEGHPFIERIYEADIELKELAKLYGRRNIACNTSAPTGSVSTMTQTSSGVEPIFMLEYIRRKKLMGKELDTIKPDFIDQNGDKWQEIPIYHTGVKKWMEITGETDIKKSPYYGATTNEIDYFKSIDIQAACQKYIDHSISKTCSLPKDITKEDVSNLYLYAWEKGCKGFTIYREGSRSGVLISKDDATSKKEDDFNIQHAPKRPKTLDADYYVITVKGKKYGVMVGLYKNKPYEIFAYEHPSILEPCKGKITKIKQGHYDFISEKGVTIENIHLASELIEERSHTIFISMLLRHGAPIEHIVNVAKKVDENISSFSSAVRRVLSKYIPDEELSEKCPECQGKLIKIEGCVKCEGNFKGTCTYSRC